MSMTWPVFLFLFLAKEKMTDAKPAGDKDKGPPPLAKVPFGNGGATSDDQVRDSAAVRGRRLAEAIAENLGVDLDSGISHEGLFNASFSLSGDKCGRAGEQ